MKVFLWTLQFVVTWIKGESKSYEIRTHIHCQNSPSLDCYNPLKKLRKSVSFVFRLLLVTCSMIKNRMSFETNVVRLHAHL